MQARDRSTLRGASAAEMYRSTMAMMLERWNDDKMDALDAKVDDLDSKVGILDAKVGALDARVGTLDGKVDVLSSLMREQREEMREQRTEFSALQRTLVMATVGILRIFVTGFGVLAGLIVAM